MSNKPTILLTGFEPFGGSPVNPSQQIVETLATNPPPGIALRTAILPVDTQRASNAIIEVIRDAQPSAVIMLGQAGRRPAVAVERAALNVLDFHIPDNDSHQPVDEPVVPDGPAAYLATLPVRQIAEAIQKTGVPVVISNSAGTYLCNQVFYVALHHIARRGLDVPAGFIHVPSMPEQVLDKPDTPSMALSTTLIAIRVTLETLASTLTC